MQNFLSLWLNAEAQVTHGGQVQRPRFGARASFHHFQCVYLDGVLRRLKRVLRGMSSVFRPSPWLVSKPPRDLCRESNSLMTLATCGDNILFVIPSIEGPFWIGSLVGEFLAPRVAIYCQILCCSTEICQNLFERACDKNNWRGIHSYWQIWRQRQNINKAHFFIG